MNHKKKVVRRSRVHIPIPTTSPSSEQRRKDTKELLDYLKNKQKYRISIRITIE